MSTCVIKSHIEIYLSTKVLLIDVDNGWYEFIVNEEDNLHIITKWIGNQTETGVYPTQVLHTTWFTLLTFCMFVASFGLGQNKVSTYSKP